MVRNLKPFEFDRKAFIARLRNSGSFYDEALGRFMRTFAYVEESIYLYLVHRTGMHRSMANAVLSGARVESAIGYIRRIHAAETSDDTPVPPELEELLQRLAALNTARNDIVHYGAFEDGIGRVVSNVAKAHVPTRVKEWHATVDILNAMTEDAEKLNVSLLCLFTQGRKLKSLQRDEALKRAWQYTPPSTPRSQSKLLELEDQRLPQDLPFPPKPSRR